MRIGLIARSDNTGLGNQTLELSKILQPSKILLINSKPFNGNTQHPDWYKDYDCITTNGFATDDEVLRFLSEVDVVFSCEIFYHPKLVSWARKQGKKTFLQYNYEFLENLQNPDMHLPDVLISPSSWNLDEVVRRFGKTTSVVHLPPPTNHSLFNQSRENNLNSEHKTILHVAGKIAARDRNGTDTVMQMLKYSTSDYQLVIKAQTSFVATTRDSRLTIDNDSPENREDLYSGYDAMVLPRRYAGLCLPMNEALLSGLPVFMTDISPNNDVLPKDWLVKSKVIDQFRTKAVLDVYEASPRILAAKIDEYINLSSEEKRIQKDLAVNIGMERFSTAELRQKYIELISSHT